MPALQDAIQATYEVFARYPLRSNIGGCPHCELDNAEDALHSKALRDLSWDDLRVFSFKAMTTFGDLDDYRHFLPRILDLLATDYDNEPYGVGHVLSKLQYGEWHDWPDDERSAVQGFLATWLATLPVDEREDVSRELVHYGIQPPSGED